MIKHKTIEYEALVKIPTPEKINIYKREQNGKLIHTETCTIKDFENTVKNTTNRKNFIFAEGIFIVNSSSSLKERKNLVSERIVKSKEMFKKNNITIDQKDFFDPNTFDSKIYDSLGFVYNEKTGWSIVAIKAIPKDTILTIYSGELTGEKRVKETEEHPEYAMKTSYSVKQLGGILDAVINPITLGGIGSFFNHAPKDENFVPVHFIKQPLTENLKKVRLLTKDNLLPVCVMKTKDDIPEGTELCFDYSLDYYWQPKNITPEYIDQNSGHLLKSGVDYFTLKDILERGEFSKDQKGFYVKHPKNNKETIFIDLDTLHRIENLTKEIYLAKKIVEISKNFQTHPNINNFISVSSYKNTLFKNVVFFEKDAFKLLINSASLSGIKPSFSPFFSSDPTLLTVKFQKAWKAEDYETAFMFLENYLKLKPRDYSARYNLARACEEIGDDRKALNNVNLILQAIKKEKQPDDKLIALREKCEKMVARLTITAPTVQSQMDKSSENTM